MLWYTKFIIPIFWEAAAYSVRAQKFCQSMLPDQGTSTLTVYKICRKTNKTSCLSFLFAKRLSTFLTLGTVKEWVFFRWSPSKCLPLKWRPLVIKTILFCLLGSGCRGTICSSSGTISVRLLEVDEVAEATGFGKERRSRSVSFSSRVSSSFSSLHWDRVEW